MDSILREYDSQKPLFESFAEYLKVLITQLLSEHQIRVHTIEARVKERNSLLSKLNKTGAPYQTLKDVTDICGLRVITYMVDDVKAIGQVIEKEFLVDKGSSVDKRLLLDPDRFGYLSLHYVVSLSKDREKLTECKRFQRLTAEIQIRSIVQHAWAEIEHDLGYKSTLAIPGLIQRRFFRLAALLELADTEFSNISKEVSAYSSEVKRQIEDNYQNIPINKDTLAAFAASKGPVRQISNDVATQLKVQVNDDFTPSDFELSALNTMGIHTIEQLDQGLKENQGKIIRFMKESIIQVVPSQNITAIRAAVSLSYFGLLLFLTNSTDAQATLAANGFPITQTSWQMLTKAFKEASADSGTRKDSKEVK